MLLSLPPPLLKPHSNIARMGLWTVPRYSSAHCVTKQSNATALETTMVSTRFVQHAHTTGHIAGMEDGYQVE